MRALGSLRLRLADGPRFVASANDRVCLVCLLIVAFWSISVHSVRSRRLLLLRELLVHGFARAFRRFFVEGAALDLGHWRDPFSIAIERLKFARVPTADAAAIRLASPGSDQTTGCRRSIVKPRYRIALRSDDSMSNVRRPE
jgi:hypothetical protein